MPVKKGTNPNHPRKGSSIKVEPIRKLKDVKLIKNMLRDMPLDYALFVIGINTNLRASDLLQITPAQVKLLCPGDFFQLREKKTRKYRQVILNEQCIEALDHLFKHKKIGDWDYLFTGQRGRWTVPTVSQKVKKWCRDINLKGNYGAHSLRKTWGFHQYHTFKQPLPILCQCFNHASQRQTLDYLCIEEQEIRDVFMNGL